MKIPRSTAMRLTVIRHFPSRHDLRRRQWNIMDSGCDHTECRLPRYIISSNHSSSQCSRSFARCRRRDCNTLPKPAGDPSASIFLEALINSASECANGNNEVLKCSRVALRSGTGKRGREVHWAAKLGIEGAAAFQFSGRGPVR
jgi:hypothetical protein